MVTGFGWKAFDRPWYVVPVLYCFRGACCEMILDSTAHDSQSKKMRKTVEKMGRFMVYYIREELGIQTARIKKTKRA